MTSVATSPADPLALLTTGPVAECVLRLRADPEPARRLVAGVEEAERLAMSDLARSLDATARLVQLADEIAEPFPRARARRAAAQALAYANRFDDALVALRAAADIADAHGLPVEAGLARMTTLHALARQGRLDDAVAAGEQARRLFENAGEQVLTARALINLGAVCQMRDQPGVALGHYDRAAPLLIDQPMLSAQLQSNRANALLDLARFDEAESALRAALASFRVLGVARAEAIAEGNLADLTGRQGRLHDAIAHFEAAIRRMGDADAPGDAARLKIEQAEAVAAVGLSQDADDLYREALPVLRERGMAWEAARGAAGFARVLARHGRLADAETQLLDAARAFAELRHDTGAARAKMALAEILLRHDRAAAAREALADAAALVTSRDAESVVATLGLARIALRQHDWSNAESTAAAGIAQAQRLDLAPMLADLLHARAIARRRLGRPADAMADLRAAVEQVERVRGMLQADRFRAAFHGDRARVYQDAASLALDTDGAPDTAFLLTERSKSRTLLEILRADHPTARGVSAAPALGDDAQSALVADLAVHRSALNALYAQLDGGAARNDAAPDMALWRQRVQDHERHARTLERRLAATDRFADAFVDAATLDQVRRSLDGDTTLVEYFADGEGGDELSAFVITPDGVSVQRGVATLAAVAERADAFAFQVGRAMTRGLPDGPTGDRLARDAQRELDALARLVLAPMLPAIASPSRRRRRVVVVPHGVLHAVPFHALPVDGDRALMDAVDLSTCPSAAVFARLQARCSTSEHPDERPRPALVVGVADPSIPNAEHEARQIVATLGDATALIGPDATRDAFLRAAARDASGRGPRLIHVAGHARYVHTNPAASGLKLADGWLTATDIADLRLDAAGITLSACDTGRVARTHGEELFGLSRAFFSAGARSLVVSLWPVHDRFAAEMMVKTYAVMYDSRRQGRPATFASALSQARSHARQTHPHPAAWAPFAIVGAP